jgi:putative endonuclease
MYPKDALGRRGEQLAAEYLTSAGFPILDRNYRRVDGEIEHLRGVG